MKRKRSTALAALEIFAALAFAVSAAGSQTTRATVASRSASFDARTSNASSTQRRRRTRRLRKADELLPGVWGGQHIRFEVTDDGARIDLDCAHGSLDGKIFVDGAGRFNATAFYQQEHGGPVREEEEARGERVTLTGRVGGSLMTLTITRGRTKIGTYTLTRGREARVVKCR